MFLDYFSLGVFLLNTKSFLSSDMVIWLSKPYIFPLTLMRSVAFIIIIGLFCWFEMFLEVAFVNLGGLPIYAWTLIVLIFAWLFSLLQLVFVWLTNLYLLRLDSLEAKHGLVTLRSFVVTPNGFSDLEVCQSLCGRIFCYGNVIVRSQSENTTKLLLVQSPFEVAERIRAVLGKPSVRVYDKFI